MSSAINIFNRCPRREEVSSAGYELGKLHLFVGMLRNSKMLGLVVKKALKLNDLWVDSSR